MSLALAPLRVAVVFGTRPEAVKLLPVLRRLGADARFAPRLVLTGQHREMVDQILGPFSITPDDDLDIMQPGQSLNDIVVRTIPALEAVYQQHRPELVLVQGDTTSAFCAALAAFHRRIRVAHLEAGLRSHDRFHPYPEEANRRMVSSIADLHLAPTRRAAECLAREGIPAETVVVTGNTVVDALLDVLDLPPEVGEPAPALPPAGQQLVLITLHRREAWDSPGADGLSVLEGILGAIARVAERHPGVTFVYPVHLNPRGREPAQDLLSGLPNVQLVPPVPYIPFVRLMARARLVLTDSGGIQEEAPSLGIPVLVARKTTERPEALASGANQLVGTDPVRLEAAMTAALAQPAARPDRLPAPNPFGDGQAAARVAAAILHMFDRGPPAAAFE
jgi:UDP-N-acetylglucosamine 2-epimerase (non-hydrolysing)